MSFILCLHVSQTLVKYFRLVQSITHYLDLVSFVNSKCTKEDMNILAVYRPKCDVDVTRKTTRLTDLDQ